MKCLCVIGKYWPSVGGSEMHTREIMRNLSKKHDVTVASFCVGDHQSNEMAIAHNEPLDFLDNGVRTLRFAPNHLYKKALAWFSTNYENSKFAKALYSVFFMIYANRMLKKHVKKSDIVHLVYNGLTPLAEVTALLANRFKKPFIITPLLSFGIDISKAHPGARILNVIKKASGVIVLTKLEQDYLIKLGVEPQKIAIIPVGPMLSKQSDAQQFLSTHVLSKGPKVLFLARHVVGKGYQLLANAMSNVWEQHPSTQFLFMGPKSPEAKKFLARFQDHRVICIENGDQQLKTDALAACDLLCVPTLHEGLGGVFIEAWMHKKPVVTSAIPILNEVVKHDERGILVPPAPTAIADGINSLLSMPKHAKELGENGYQHAIQFYKWSVISEKVNGLYRQQYKLSQIS